MTLAAGSHLGPYEVRSLIGAGGMGEVYRARDARLGRDVAMKVLPLAFASDAERLARFERETRVLAALNHPNIATIYGIEDGDGVVAIVMELIEGESLAHTLKSRGPLPLEQTLALVRQIAEGLDAAHQRGIVHRDLKPANVVVSHDGRAKILDFGLARISVGDDGTAESQSPTITLQRTREGAVMGTPAYMSPEQVGGEAVDKRTDIWAFGCVLFEMLTGRAPFARGTLTDTLAAIVDREPDWTVLPESTPTNIRRLLRRCLEKDLRRRCRDIGDAAIEIEDAVATVPTAERAAAAVVPHESRPWRSAGLAAAGVVAMAVLVGAGVRIIRGGATGPLPRAAITQTMATRLTDYGVRETYGALSPDGRSFVFVSDHAGTPDIWLRQVSGGEPVRLTNDPAEEADLVYAADGETVYFTKVDSSGLAIWQLGALGGEARKVMANAAIPTPSPDGKTLAYFGPDPENNSEWALFASALDGEHRRTLTRHLGFNSSRAAWSRDGRWLSYSRAALFGPCNLFVIDITTGRERQVTHYTRSNEGLSCGGGQSSQQWLPDNRHLIVSYRPFPRHQAPDDLGVLEVEDGSIARLTIAVDNGYSRASVSADGSRLVAEAGHALQEVWKVPLSTSIDIVGRTAVRLFDRGSPFWIFVSRDARWLLFNGTLTGSRNLWLARLDDTISPRQVTRLPGDVVSHSSLSPDATHVAFASTATGTSHIWTQNVDGTELRQLTDGAGNDSWPVWSPDGRSIVYSADFGNRREAWRVPAAGGTAEKLIDGFFRGDWIRHSDGRSLIVTSGGGNVLRLIDVDRRDVLWEKSLEGGAIGLPLFSPDGRSISMPYREARDHDAVQVFDVETGASHLASRLPFHVSFRATWADNGTSFIVNRSDSISHIVMFDRFWEAQGPR